MKTIIVMPIYNEAHQIDVYLRGLLSNLPNKDFSFVCVEDYSSDSTLKILRQIKQSHENLVILENESNLGHGPSLIRGLKLAALQDCDIVISIDSDGDVGHLDILLLRDLVSDGNCQYALIIRKGRTQTRVRKFISQFSNLFLGSLTGANVIDANSPFRAYRKWTLNRVLKEINDNSVTPNLAITYLVNRFQFNPTYTEIDLSRSTFEESLGSTWKNLNSVKRIFKLSKLSIFSAIQLILLVMKVSLRDSKG